MSNPLAPADPPHVVVIKLGGSALGTPDWATRFRVWLESKTATYANTHFVVIVGGGPLVDGLRTIDKHARLSDSTTHWGAIRLMDEAAHLVAAALGDVKLCRLYDDLLTHICCPGVTIFAVSQFLSEIDPRLPGGPLPESWDVTSDSIAGRVAIALGARELILLKPRGVEGPGARLHALVATGVVDRHFSALSGQIPQIQVESLSSRDLAGEAKTEE